MSTPNITVQVKGGTTKVESTTSGASARFPQAAFDAANNASLVAHAAFNKANAAVQTGFVTVNVAGQSDVVADSNTDTLTLIGGTGVTITTNATDDSVMIALTGAGAATDQFARDNSNGAFNKANSANVIAQAAFNKANTANVIAQAAFNKANTITANVLSVSGKTGVVVLDTNDIAENASSNLWFTAARVRTNISNTTPVNYDPTTGVISHALSGVTASGYGDSLTVPKVVVDAKGHVTSVVNTTIQLGSTAQVGLVRLEDSVTSVSTSNAATPNSVNSAHTLANIAEIIARAAFDKANTIQLSAASVGPGQIYYLNTTPAERGNNSTLSRLPSLSIETHIDSLVSSGTIQLIRHFVANVAIGAIQIDAGEWKFETWANTTTSEGNTEVLVRASKRVLQNVGLITSTGTGATRSFQVYGDAPFVASDANADITLATVIELPNNTFFISTFVSSSNVTATEQYSNTTFDNEANVAFSLYYTLFPAARTGDIEALTDPLLFTNVSTQQATTCNTTDKIVVGYFSRTDNASPTNVSIFLGGSEHYSRVLTPVAVTHNQLSGLQGGTTDEFYHLTASEYSKLGPNFDHANGAFNKANTANVTGQAAFDKANGAFTKANGAVQTGFPTLNIAGQSDVVADSNTDTLTFVAGAGIVLTTDAPNDTITIAATGASATDQFARDQANAAFNRANTANTTGQAAFDKANAAVVSVSGKTGVVVLDTNDVAENLSSNLWFTAARARANISNTAPINYDPVTGTISHADSGVGISGYGDAATIPVVELDSGGHITSITNTAIAIAASQITSGALAVARGGTGQTAITVNGSLLIGNTVSGKFDVNPITQGTNITVTNSKGSITISSSDAFAQTQANGAFDHANGAFTKANSANVTGQAAFDKANGAIYTAAQIRANISNTAPINYDSSTGVVSHALSGVTASGYGDAATVPKVVVDDKGHVTSVTNTAIAISAAAITSGTLAVARGGTGQTAITVNGSLLIGNTVSGGFDVNPITQGTNITVTNDKGSITIASSDAFAQAQANAAFGAANTADARAQLARDHSNGAFDKANTANVTGQAAFDKANSNFTLANTANTVAASAYAQANIATTNADAAFVRANTANVTGQAAFDKANGAAQLSFVTVNVAGQSDVVADSNTDTLTLVSGAGIVITTDAPNDRITVTATANVAQAEDQYARHAANQESAFIYSDYNGQARYSDWAELYLAYVSAGSPQAIIGFQALDGLGPLIIPAGEYTFRPGTTFRGMDNGELGGSIPYSSGTVFLTIEDGVKISGVGIWEALGVSYEGTAGPAVWIDSNTVDVDGHVVVSQPIILRNTSMDGTAGTSHIFHANTGDGSIRLYRSQLLGNVVNLGDTLTFTIDIIGSASIISANNFASPNAEAIITINAETDKNQITIGEKEPGIFAGNVIVQASGFVYGTTDDRPGTVEGALFANGQFYYDTTLDAPAWANNSVWRSVREYFSNTAPINFEPGTGVFSHALSGVTASGYGDAATVPKVVVDDKGHVTSVTNTAIAISAAAITSGTLAVARGGTGQTAITVNGSLLIGNTVSGGFDVNAITQGAGVLITNAPGSITVAANVTSVAGRTGAVVLNTNDVTENAAGPFYFTAARVRANISNTAPINYDSGTGAISHALSGVSASGYGDAATVPKVVVDATGHVTSVTNTSIAISAAAITSGTLAVARGGTGQTAITVNGSLLIGNTVSGGFDVNPITPGTNITISNDKGSITIASSDAFAQAQANAAFSAANTADARAQLARDHSNGAFDKANTANITGQAAFDKANGAIYTADQIRANISNTAPINYDSSNGIISHALSGATASGYGDAATVPKVVVDDKGHVTSVTNTSIAISAAQVTSGTLAVARGGTGQTAVTVNGSLFIGNTVSGGFDVNAITQGAGITVTNDKGSITIAANTTNKPYLKSIAVTSPVVTDNITFFFTDAAITFNKVVSVVQGTTPNVVFNLTYESSRHTGADRTNITGNITCANTTNGVFTTTFTNATVPANNYVTLTFSTVSGTVTEIAITMIA